MDDRDASKTKMVVRMEAKGTIKNPDGTTKEVVLRAERPLTEDEVKNHGNHTFDRSS